MYKKTMKGKTRNRILAVVLSATVMISGFPVNVPARMAAAEDSGDETYEEILNDEFCEDTLSDEMYEEVGEESLELLLYAVETGDPLEDLAALAASAGSAASVSINGTQIEVDDGGLILLSNTSVDLEGYTVFLSALSGGYADLTKTITVEDQTYSFQGLGSDAIPFSGEIKSQDPSYGVIVNTAFFNCVDVSKASFTNLQTLKIKRKNTETALLAEKVQGVSGDSWNSFAIQAEKGSHTVGGTTTEYLPGELIGTMDVSASLLLGTVIYPEGAAVSSAAGNAGLLCDTMRENSSLSVQNLTVSSGVTVKADRGAAGGLVGCMETGAILTAGNADAVITVGSDYTITGKNSGGLVGSGTAIRLGGNVTVNGAKVRGSVAAGGLMGSYTTGEGEGTLVSYDGSEDSTLRADSVNLETITSDNVYAGGLFGILELKSDFTISDASVTSSIAGKKARYGGLAGQVKGDSADSLRALTIDGTTDPITAATVNLGSYGGAAASVGNDGGTPVYLKITDTFTPSFNGAAKGICFGGAAAYLHAASVMELAEHTVFTPIGCSDIPVRGGGVVGNAERGSTLCLAGTTDLSNTKFETIGSASGQIVGSQESALIYAGSGWTLIRQSEAQMVDDIGTYGEVIRLGGNRGKGASGNTSGLSAGLICQNASTHKTEFAESAKAVPDDTNTFTVASADQLALLAIEEQTRCAFQIFSQGSDYFLKSNANITLGADISLAHTGIIGIQRDVDPGYSYEGVFDGGEGDHILTVSAGEIYGFRGTNSTEASRDTPGSGQIHGHGLVGFFSRAGGTMKDLSIDGEMNLHFREDFAAGGLVAKNTGVGTFYNVTTSVAICCRGEKGGFVGGLLGQKQSAGSPLTISGCTGSASIDIGKTGIYAGGLIGSYNDTGRLTVSSTTLCGTLTAAGSEHARSGGLVSRIAAGSYSSVDVALTGITVDGQSITGTNINGKDAAGTCGGLLGYEWNNTTVTFGDRDSHSNGVTVKGASAVSITGNAKGAGLVYAATGYWQVNHIDLQSFSITSGSGDLGLLICRGWKRDSDEAKPYLLYIEETQYQAYRIGETVTVTNGGGCFDEWAVYTCNSAETITENGNSVISIATPGGTRVEGERAGVDPDGNTCTGYQNRTSYGKTAEANPNARYYYDLDLIREKAAANGFVDTPGELVLWAVWRYTEEKTITDKSNIQDYFYISGKSNDITGTDMSGNNAIVDLTGYAYYPISVDGFSLNVQNITVRFANQMIEEAEDLTGGGLDSLNRTTAGTPESHTQHYLMHSGLLLDYKNSRTEKDVTLSVSGVSLQGSIGKGPEGIGSGTLICGQLGGNANAATPKYTKADINGLTLDGITVNADKTSDGYAPLLLNRVGSYAALTAQQISSSGYDGFSAAEPAATSLIGHVGGEAATNISLAFYNGIDLGGKKEDSVFSHATLLESFRYADANSSGYYHFNQGEPCTYGKEISESAENPGLQLWYYDGQTGDVKAAVKDGENSDFAAYLPYVCQPYSDGSDKYHELEVNMKSPDLTEGCGTYDDPYLISSPGQLLRAAQFINGGTPQGGWKVNMVTDAGAVRTENNENHAEYEAGKTGWKDETMRNYLRGAYYQLQDNLDLSNFPGFGSGTYPFVGVIDGNGKNVTINAVKNESGLINVSYGSVVRELTITYSGEKRYPVTDEDPAKADNTHTVTEKSYFGGIIGTVKGGDSLIDNVKVQFDHDFSITTTNELQCGGGFVGLIQGGGVVFRNMGDTQQNPGYTGTDSSHYYVDKYIGRVLDGYAINETDAAGAASTFSAGEGKNYSIPDISSVGTISWGDGNINISNGQQMIIFTDIINCGAAAGGGTIAYDPGNDQIRKAKTRNADYSKIGSISDASDAAFKAARRDDTSLGADNKPYLIVKYAGGDDEFRTACTGGAISVTFSGNNTEIDLSPYGNGYRGIGGRYNCTASQNSSGTGNLTLNAPMIENVTGNGVSLRVSNDIAEYKTDNFYVNAAGGLFNVLRHEGATVSDVNVTGTVKVCAGLGKDDLLEQFLARAPVGGIIGRDYSTGTNANEKKTLSLTGVSFGTAVQGTRSVAYGECVTGGLIGSSGSYKYTAFRNAAGNVSVLEIADCSYRQADITGGMCTGGFLGAVVRNRDHITYFDAGYSVNADLVVQISWRRDLVTGSDASIKNLYDSTANTPNGVGGLIGFISTHFTVQGNDPDTPVLNDVTLYGGKTKKKGRIGGLVGFANNQSSLTCTIENVCVSNVRVGMTDTSSYDDNGGGIVGTWHAPGTLTVKDSTVTDSVIQANSAGGIVGYGGRGRINSVNIRLSDITVKKRGSVNVGGLGGYVGINFYGRNILLQDMTYDNMNANRNDMGRFFGTGTYARLLGVTVQQNNGKPLPKVDIQNKAYPADYGTTNYVVYAGYKSTGTITSAGDIAEKPSQVIDGLGNLHGDTVEPDIVIGAASDSDTYYQNLSAEEISTDKITEKIRSTYNGQQENRLSDAADFPVVLVDGDASVLRQYLNAATNGGFDSMRSYNNGQNIKVELARYVCESGTFRKADADAYPDTLVYHSATGEFTTTAQFDNQKDTFTLVTVTMTGDMKDTFVLQIPVIVRRMLQVDFMATMTSGTVFNKTDAFYSETRNHALASQGETITGYLTFHYNSNASDTANTVSYDWQSYLEAGGDLLGYYKKTVNTGTSRLPAGTQITLIDCQNQDRRYYAEVENGKSTELELFNGGNLTFASSDGELFTPASLSDLLEVTAAEATEPEKEDAAVVKWVKLTDEAGATVKDTNNNYYRLYDEAADQEITELYTLKVGNSSPKENYFVVISVPQAGNHRMTLTKAGMVWSNAAASSPPLEVHQVHRYDRTKLDPENSISEASFNYLENYTQSLADQTAAGNIQVQATDAKVDLPIHVTDTVSFNSQNYRDTDPLYQKLVISLKKTENGATANVGLPSDAAAVEKRVNEDGTTTCVRENGVKLYAYYIDASSNKHYYVWNGSRLVDSGSTKVPAVSYSWSGNTDSSEMVLPFAAKTEDGYQYIDLAGLRKASGTRFYLEAETILELSTASVLSNNTIPYDSASGEISNYTQADAASILSFTESGLSYSTLRGSTSGRKNIRKYYLNTARKAVLRLDYTNLDQLGINPREERTASIDTVLTLDCSNLEGFVGDVTAFKALSDADTVRFTLSLRKKGDGEYTSVPIADYMDGAAIPGNTALPDYIITLKKREDGSYPYYNEQTGKFTVPVSFTVKTDGNEFANYRICADVWLQKEGTDLNFDVNVSDAYITYTYAKINVNGYWEHLTDAGEMLP